MRYTREAWYERKRERSIDWNPASVSPTHEVDAGVVWCSPFSQDQWDGTDSPALGNVLLSSAKRTLVAINLHLAVD